MKLFLGYLLVFGNLLQASGVSDVEERSSLFSKRIALVATLLVFPNAGIPVSNKLYREPGKETDWKIRIIKERPQPRDFFAIYLKRIEDNLHKTIEDVHTFLLPYHVRYMPEACAEFSRNSPDYKKTIQHNLLFKKFKSRRASI